MSIRRPSLPIVTALIAAAGLSLAARPASAQKLVLVAGGGSGGDGSAAVDAKLGTPFGVERDAAGNTYVVEYTNRLLRIDPAGVLTTVAGTGEKGSGGDGGPGAAAQFNVPHAIAVAPDGAVYVADTGNHRVRKFDPKAGVVTTFAGTTKGFAGDGGPASAAQFNGIYSVALDPKGKRMVLADLENRRVRAIDMNTGVVTTVAGNGDKGVPADGADAATSPLVDPRAAEVDAAGNVYVLERGGHALRVVTPDGKIRTVAGTGKKGATGDGGPAREATLNGPKHLWVDAADDVLIADAENNLVRKYEPRTGRIVRVAGNGQKGTAGLGGPPDQAQLNRPHGVYVDPQGAVYICDSYGGRVLKVVP